MTHNINEQSFCIYLSPDNAEIQHLIEIRTDNYRLFTPIAKDFVRVVLYQQFSVFIPKGVKERTDYITKVLHNKKEEYDITYDNIGYMDDLIERFKKNEISLDEIARIAKIERNKHQQTINPNQIGNVSDVMPSVSDQSIRRAVDNLKVTSFDENIPMPPILCLDSDTKMRILKTDEETPVLNNNKLFMALTDKVVSSKRIFFTNPHTTRILWSMHRLIYIFTDALGKNTIYYDMELKHKIPDSTGGRTIRSTTIITKDKIFVPVVEELYNYFDIGQSDKLKFYVHFDELENN